MIVNINYFLSVVFASDESDSFRVRVVDVGIGLEPNWIGIDWIDSTKFRWAVVIFNSFFEGWWWWNLILQRRFLFKAILRVILQLTRPTTSKTSLAARIGRRRHSKLGGACGTYKELKLEMLGFSFVEILLKYLFVIEFRAGRDEVIFCLRKEKLFWNKQLLQQLNCHYYLNFYKQVWKLKVSQVLTKGYKN